MIGHAVLDDPDEDAERPQQLYEFLQAHRLWLPNTWLPGDDPQLWKTRFPWDNIRELRFTGEGKQIGFIALSMFQSVDDVKIARDMMFSSDHLPLSISYSSQNRKSQRCQTNMRGRENPCCSKTRLPLIRNWQPDDNWYNAIRLSTLSWQDWEAIPRLRELAHEHAKPRVNKQVDVELESLLLVRKNTTALKTKQKLGRTIWRARRKAKRQRMQCDLEDACRNKRCPKPTRRSMHFNWSKTFGPNGDASKQLFDYYSGVYELTPDQRKYVAEWKSDFETGTQPLRIPVETLKMIIKKLKPGKGSSDGITAEILRELDDSNLEAMAAALESLFLFSELPQTWSEITATLVPKLAVPSGPKDFRPIASLVTLRKLVGYLFLHFTPTPSWQSLQCGFVSQLKQSFVSRDWVKWQKSGSDTCT